MSSQPATARLIPLSRHYEAALEKGALLVAVARCRLTDREPLYELRPRHHAQLVELLHDFCYNARKAIELAEDYEPGMIDHAARVSLPGYDERTADVGLEVAVPLANQSLWWILSRVIHSREVVIIEREDVEVGSAWAASPHTTSYLAPVVFSVRSDRDEPLERHHVRAERAVEAFLALRERFGRALLAAQGPSA